MRNLKIAVVGCGGIGSYFIRGLSESIKKDITGFNAINVMGIDLFDYDLVEEKNLSYQNFDIEHIGQNKAEVMAEITGYKAKAEKIEIPEQLQEYDLVVMAVDNNEVRNIVYNSGVKFLDLRAKGTSVMAYLTAKGDNNYLELTKDDGTKGGCQYANDIEEKNIQMGNRIIAEIGLQYLVDYLRGKVETKNTILMI